MYLRALRKVFSYSLNTLPEGTWTGATEGVQSISHSYLTKSFKVVEGNKSSAACWDQRELSQPQQ